MGQGPRLARAGAGDDPHAALRRRHGLTLGVVQPLQQIHHRILPFCEHSFFLIITGIPPPLNTKSSHSPAAKTQPPSILLIYLMI